MLVLFDQGTPAPLRHALVGHAVETAYERGWSSLNNGELIAAAEAAGFEVLVTTDKNLKYQQNLTGRCIAIVVLHTPFDHEFNMLCQGLLQLLLLPIKALTPRLVQSDALPSLMSRAIGRPAAPVWRNQK